jgi:2-(1,2-epoxy-1,2-dihydrophenyl)acetyl-CoA isomerase
MDEPVLFQVDGPVGTVVLNRPKALNAIDLEMARGLGRLAGELPRRDDLRVVVVKGAGAAFAAGGDVAAFRGAPEELAQRVGEIIDHFHAFILALRSMAPPVVGAIRGVAAGGGFSLALATDLTLAADDARFAPAYRRLGTSPDGGGTFFLSRLVGPKRAAELFLAGGSYGADEALRLGLVNRVVPAASLDDEVSALAATLAANARCATRETKALLNRELLGPLREHLAAEKRAFLECAATSEFAEGVAAFVEKRAPRFG